MKIRSILAGSLSVAMILTGSLAANATDPHSGSGHGSGQNPPQDPSLSVGQGQTQGQGQTAQGGAGGNGGSSNNSGNGYGGAGGTSYGSQQGQGQTAQGGAGGNGGSSNNSGNGYGGTGNGGAGGTSYGSQQGQGQTAQGGAGGNGGQVQDSGNSANTNSGNGYGGSVGNTTANGGSNQNHINTQGGAGGSSTNSGNGYGGSANGGSASTGPVTNTNGGNSLTGGNNTGGNLSFTDNSKSTYRVAPPQFAPIPGTPGSSTYQTLVCLPNGQVMVVNNQVQGKSDGFNLTIPFVGGGFGYTSTRPSQNSAYWISQSERARVNAELMTADGTASHPLGSLFLSEYTQTSVYATGKARKLNDKQLLALSQKASNAVEATVAKSKQGSVAMGCGRVGDQQVIVAPSPVPGPAPVEPVQPVEPGPAPIEVPAVPSNPGSIPASH
jgi:hypothetical protein